MIDKTTIREDIHNVKGIKIEENTILTDNEKLILTELTKIDNSLEPGSFLAVSFLGALTVYKNNIPDKYAITAHCIREIIEKMPRILDVPDTEFSLSSEIRNLEKKWNTILKNKDFRKNSILFNDKNLFPFLKKLDVFFNRFSRSILTKKEQAVKLIRSLDSSKILLPSTIENIHADEWVAYYKYFSNVSHHTHIPNEGKFSQWLNAFMQCLSDKLRRRTFINIDKIERIIKEGEEIGK